MLQDYVLPCFVLTQIRLVVEEGLNQLPYKETVVTTPTGCEFQGVQFEHGNCGVSIMRSGMLNKSTGTVNWLTYQNCSNLLEIC